MKLDATVLTVNQLLHCEFKENFRHFLQKEITHYSIPDYQREYKWDKARIKTFVDNVMEQSKFLGILTAEVSDQDCLYIVDGQQRLTTIVLLLAWLYNACGKEGETETQEEILELLTFPSGEHRNCILENGSVGNFLKIKNDESGLSTIELHISESNDIYQQKKAFDEAWGIIDRVASEKQNASTQTLEGYKKYLLDCQVLLFVQRNEENVQQGSIEEIYIDINEKSKRLDAEDIFKGHCFALCKTVQTQAKVKERWKSIKKQLHGMSGMLTKRDMNTFLHSYLFAKEAFC